MRKLFFLGFLLLCADCSSQNLFILKGTFSGEKTRWIYLRYDNGKDILDSSRVEGGFFSFSGEIDEPTSAVLKLNRYPIPDEENINSVQIILEPREMDIKVTHNAFRDGILTGSKTHNEFVQLRKSKQSFSDKYVASRDSLSKLKPTKLDTLTDRDVIVNLNRSRSIAVADIWKTSYKFIEEHTDSWVSAFELNSFKTIWGIDSVKYLYTRLTDRIKDTREAKRVLRKINMADEALSSIGSIAADFSRIGVDGSPITLSNFRGQYVLLDFWGSWCGPCRAGNPHLIELYKKYGGVRLEFIGIACQDQVAAWRSAIKEDGIGIWKHILDLNQTEVDRFKHKTTIAERFAVNSFPAKILIDPSGRVIARFHGGDDEKLKAKLRELLD
jgi:thiol-disulfide isomerase/thioredoxin